MQRQRTEHKFNAKLGASLTTVLRSEYPEMKDLTIRVRKDEKDHDHSQSLYMETNNRSVIFVDCELAAKVYLAILSDKSLEQLKKGLIVFYHELAHTKGIDSELEAWKYAVKMSDNPAEAFAAFFAILDILCHEDETLDIDATIKGFMLDCDEQMLDQDVPREIFLHFGLTRNVGLLSDAEWDRVKSLYGEYSKMTRFLIPSVSALDAR